VAGNSVCGGARVFELGKLGGRTLLTQIFFFFFFFGGGGAWIITRTLSSL
jgi:hypothetical protein